MPQRFPSQRPIAENLIDAIAKTVAELASQQNGLIRQQLIEQLIALRRATSAVSSHAKH
jgi:hypothetical protein